RRFRRQTEDTPWITADGVAILEGLLRPGDVGVEFGSGGSTTWFASRVEHLHSVEGADPWHAEVTSRLRKAGLDNVSYHLASQLELGVDHPDARQAYVNFAPELAPGSQDFVFVDGEYRDECAMRALELLKPGGVLILDNANTYLPNALRSPWKVARPSTPRWAEFVEATADWRSIWTTNGVWDTAFWFKPWCRPSVVEAEPQQHVLLAVAARDRHAEGVQRLGVLAVASAHRVLQPVAGVEVDEQDRGRLVCIREDLLEGVGVGQAAGCRELVEVVGVHGDHDVVADPLGEQLRP
ncbi:MAG: O-methyltransferase, partial [Marmoricola sp.]